MRGRYALVTFWVNARYREAFVLHHSPHRLIRYAIDNGQILGRLFAIRDHPAERFGDAAARIILFRDWVREDLDTECVASPFRHCAHRLASETSRVKIFTNPDAQFRVCLPNMMKARQANETAAVALTNGECEIRSFGDSSNPGRPDLIEYGSVGGWLP